MDENENPFGRTCNVSFCDDVDETIFIRHNKVFRDTVSWVVCCRIFTRQ